MNTEKDVSLATALRQIGGQLITDNFTAYPNNSDVSSKPVKYRYCVIAAESNPGNIGPIYGKTLAEIKKGCNVVRRNMILCYGKTHFE